jgi:hypothetical protein
MLNEQGVLSDYPGLDDLGDTLQNGREPGSGQLDACVEIAREALTRIWNGPAPPRRKREQSPAEIASLSLIKPQPGDHVVLLHSQTPDGAFCARVLMQVLQRNDIAPGTDYPFHNKVDLVEVRGLRISDSVVEASKDEFVREGLVGYVNAVWEQYAKPTRGSEIIFNITGGYKGMILVARDLALLLTAHSRDIDPRFTCKVCYLYQDSSDLIIYGALPVQFIWNRRLKEFLNRAPYPHGAPSANLSLGENPEWIPFFEAVPGQPTHMRRSALGEVTLALYNKLRPDI